MFSNRKKAFTLIEMLVVVIIIGIILAIVISSASTLLNNRSKKAYNIHIDLVESAIKTYIDQYKGQLSNDDSSCFNIDYNSLVSDGILEEGTIKCNGNIIVTKGVNNNFTSDFYFSCNDENGDSVKVSDPLPSGCKGFNGKFRMEYAIYEDINKQKVYEGTSYVKNAYVYFTSTSPYQTPISHFEYTINLDGNWTKIDASTNLSSLDTLKNYSGNLYVRSVDVEGNVSSSVQIPIKMDNIGPSFDTSISGTYLTKTISISNVSDSGVKTLDDKAYSFDGGITWISDMQDSFDANGIYNVCSRDSLGNITCKEVTINSIDRVVPSIPTITASDGKGSGSWHNSNFTLTLSGANNASGNTYYYGETENDVLNKKNAGTIISISNETSSKTYYMMVCSGAGLCSNVTSYEVKLDKKIPEVPSIVVSDDVDTNIWHTGNFNISISGGGDNISDIYYYYGTTVSASNLVENDKVDFSTNTTAVTYYFKACSGAGLCSDNTSYIVKLDKVVPEIIAKNASNYITTTTGKALTDYFDLEYGVSGASIVCKVGDSVVTNTNNLSLGVNTVICTLTNGVGKNDSASTEFRHQYVASGTPVYSTKTYTPSYSCPAGGSLSGTSCIKDASCTIYKKCNVCSGGIEVGNFSSLAACSSSCGSCAVINGSTTCCSGGSWTGNKRQSGCGREAASGSNCTSANGVANLACGQDWTLSGTSCISGATATCNSGDTLSGHSCINRYQTGTNYSCPSGGTLSGTTCSF